jgi:uncharacterized protein YggU (UPF0235/DUF167 family)
VTPRARRAAIGQVTAWPDGERLELAVTAPPEDGKANAAVSALLAEALSVAKSHVRVLQGATNRLKLVLVAGDAAALAERLAALVSAAGDRRR